MVKRIFVMKKHGFDIEANALYVDLKRNLGINSITGIKVICRYDIEGLSDDQYEMAKNIVFSEPPVDLSTDEVMIDVGDARVFAMEYLPGQYDQRADSAMQCIQIITFGNRPKVRSAKVIVCEGCIDDATFARIKEYLINPVEAREASLDKPNTLDEQLVIPEDVKVIDNFISCSDDELNEYRKSLGLAMDHNDIIFCRNYFKNEEKRNPTMTEIRMIDTYWSDHCRHTTFMTRLNDVKISLGIASDSIKKTWEDYLNDRKYVYGECHKDICLMDIATMAMKKLKKDGRLKGLDESEEINACSIEVDAVIDGKTEKWLVMFKNETHNHPTEIEPFGGAATCLGGAIRDPLSGRSYVYQAMRVTGSGDPRTSLANTISGKLPQRKITTGAANGYSSYGNQIGLATGQVEEIYDDGYIAKRMEIGAVIGAVPKDAVVREVPEASDAVILLGGRTGRDGCGGATGSSKAHTEESLESCGAEVQKGNPPVERKIQRLFRNKEVTRLIKRCNDFGAGGVSVAIGELADGLIINLDAVTKKYEGLDGTELAISESQERMAVVVRAGDANKFIDFANSENLEATVVAQVTDAPRLIMTWRDKKIVDIAREFLNSNGAPKDINVQISGIGECIIEEMPDCEDSWYRIIESLDQCSRRGLVEKFDATIGAGTLLMPFGGIYQLTPSEAMAAKLPVLTGDTTTATVMSFGFNPKISKWSPYHGAMYAVVEAVSKLVAAGGSYKDAYATFQEYFERLYNDATKWGKPLSALLGAYRAQIELGIAAIGGKDSMSGSFRDLDVPPTLVAFTVCATDTKNIVSPEFKKAGSKVVYLETRVNDDLTPDFDALKNTLEAVEKLVRDGSVLSICSIKADGIAPSLAKMCFGNGIGFKFSADFKKNLFKVSYGSFIVELKGDTDIGVVLGTTTDEGAIITNEYRVPLDLLIAKWEAPLERIFATQAKVDFDNEVYTGVYTNRANIIHRGIARPNVFIPVFPGTNCEYDTMRVFEKARANANVFVMGNLTGDAIEYSLKKMAEHINNSQIVVLPGGFSAGDEPDGSGKFIAAAFRNAYVKDAVHNLLKNRDGLMLGICNGFQALIKLGLVPYGEIRDLDNTCPTLTFNTIGRHVSGLINTKIASVKSPWFSKCNIGDIHTVAVSHGEGRFVCSGQMFKELAGNGQIATQYVDFNGNPTYDIEYNPNGSFNSVEGIISPDGRILGKMGHSERSGEGLYKNVNGNKYQPIFEAGVEYFK